MFQGCTGRQPITSNNSDDSEKDGADLSNSETRLLIETAKDQRKSKSFRTTTSDLPKSVLILVGLIHLIVIFYAGYSVTKGRSASGETEEDALQALLEEELALDPFLKKRNENAGESVFYSRFKRAKNRLEKRSFNFGLSDDILGTRNQYANFFDNLATKRSNFVHNLKIKPEMVDNFRGIYHGPDRHSEEDHLWNVKTGEMMNRVVLRDMDRSSELPYSVTYSFNM